MNDHLHRMYYKIEEAAQTLLTLLAVLEPVAVEWFEGSNQVVITISFSQLKKFAHPDSCAVINHLEDENGIQDCEYELQWGMSDLLTFRAFITEKEYEEIKKDQDDIPF